MGPGEGEDTMATAGRHDRNLTRGSVTKTLLVYALPLVGTSLLQAVYSITDVIIAGHFVGGSGISAINNAALITHLLTLVIIGFSAGGGVLIGQYFGAGDGENRRRTAGSLFTLCLAAGLAGGALVAPLAGPILAALRAPALAEATAYLGISALGLPFIFGYNALAAILRAMGNSRMPLCFIIASTSVNVGLDLLLVAVFNMGVRGAAIATVAAQGIAFAAALVYVLRNRAHYGLTAGYLRPDGKKLRGIARLGLPLALQSTIATASWLVVMFLINRYGVEVSAGNGISAKIRDFCQLFVSAITTGAATMVAQNLGAGNPGRARRVMLACLRTTLLASGAIILIAEFTAPWLVQAFTADAEVRRWAVANLRIEIVAQVFYAGFMSFNTLATGSGHTLFVMLNSFINCIVVRVVLAVLFESLWGIWGVYIACAVAPAISVPIGYFFYRSGRWRQGLAAKSAAPMAVKSDAVSS